MRCDILYLDDLAEAQGILFEEVVNRGYDLVDFAPRYMQTHLRVMMDKGSAKHCTMYHYDIFDELAKLRFQFKPAVLSLDSWMANWIGEFYARLQWRADRSSAYVIACVPIEQVIQSYNVLHDLDMELAIDRCIGLIK